MDFVFILRAKIERHAKPPSSLRHHLAKSGYKHQRITIAQAGMPSLFNYSLPKMIALAWSCVSKGRQSHPKGLPEGELASSSGPTGRPSLCFKDVCKKDL
ncbi:hypothetical protein ElyMa_003345000 [Elysia marginata]|uniref:Uncharacterized protein n=1 Tax=Elysia marginata TaxID=1093978 RepID=A0AAV4JIY0_9GAST|nr:hypothetical protein ElyMa_003345000 [Elysia marginata]